MKHFYLFFSLFITSIIYAQIPAGYYDYATGTGYTLKTQLKKIIDDIDDAEIVGSNEHIENVQSYNALDNFNSTYELDNYYETGSNTILDIYSENSTGVDPYNFTPSSDECGDYSGEGDCYNKEHVIPQSVFDSQLPMYSDAHHLFPTDGRVNGFRSNYPYGVVDNNQLVSQSGISNPTLNGSKLGNNINSGYSAGYTGIVFEPIDEFKGDIARVYFYFATRYEDQISAWSSYPMFNGSSDKVFDDTFLSILLTWHQNDPVSQKEIDRNNNIYYNHQGNRNPFVDHPEYVSLIWNTTPDTEAPTAPTNLIASNPTSNSIDLSWDASTDNVGINSYDIYVDGAYETNTGNSSISFTVTGLSSETNYCFTVYAKDTAGNTSSVSNQDCETTTASGGGMGDLFFSEYIEGSGTNKALEIANFTGSTVDLSNYTLKLATNGSNFSTVYSFPGGSSITNQDVFVVANSGLSPACQSQQDDVNVSITSFNGNDAIGLFKNDVLIDIIGIEGDDSDFAKDVTLIRKPTVEFPTTTFDINEWNTEAQDDCSNLGTHNQTLSIGSNTFISINLYPNPVLENYVNIKTDQSLKIEIFDVLGKSILKAHVDSNNTKIDVSRLTKGIYLVKLMSDKGSVTKKLIRQ